MLCFSTGVLFTSRSRPRPPPGWWAARECCSSCCANSVPFSATRSRPVSCGQVWNIQERNTPSYTGLPDLASTPGQLQRSTEHTDTSLHKARAQSQRKFGRDRLDWANSLLARGYVKGFLSAVKPKDIFGNNDDYSCIFFLVLTVFWLNRLN